MTIDANAPASLLARYPGPVAIHPSRFKLALHVIVATDFVAAAMWLAFHPRMQAWWPGYFLEAAAGLYFGWYAAGYARLLLSGAPFLVLHAEGFSADSGVSRWQVRWEDVHVGLFCGIHYRDRSRMQRDWLGQKVWLPRIQPMRRSQLSALMQQWRERAVAQMERQKPAA